jgi:UDP-N-acetylmuramate dehydrogenase
MINKNERVANLASEMAHLGRVRLDEPMSEYTTFRTGGPADLLVEPDCHEHAVEAFRLASISGLPLTLTGWGSNLLVGDLGIRGIVLRIGDHWSEPVGEESGLLYAPASLRKEDFIEQALDLGYGQVQFMAGIPGNIGGGIIMNAGTYMGTFADVLEAADLVLPGEKPARWTIEKDQVSYRSMGLPEEALVLGGWFSLPRTEDPERVRLEIAEVLADRRNKHPLEYPSAGSIFKNPPGHSSWKLVNDAGLKGFRVGGAMVSELHTNFIINAGGATSLDIRRCIETVQERVFNAFGVALTTEVRMVGEF